VVGGAPHGIVLPKAEGARDVLQLSNYLSALEAREGLPAGAIRILPIATETPRALFNLETYGAAGDRLAGLTWGAEDLPAAVGASVNRMPDGRFTDLCRWARTLCLAGAASAGTAAIETVYPAFSDLEGLQLYAEQGRREGFSGMMAIHPAQVPIINRAFSPNAEEIARAQRIVDAFAAEPGAGVLAVDGAMLDAPHLKQAQRLLSDATDH
jgi:citrate lyase subunit beta/citryl-CoA lyase